MVSTLRSRTPEQVHSDVAAFGQRYVDDWNRWLQTAHADRPRVFVTILGRWQAGRPARLRRLRSRANEHEAPYVEDLLEAAAPHLATLAELDVGDFTACSDVQDLALTNLWDVFSRLPQVGTATCVGITKAVLLLSEGRIGPAFDSAVRKRLGVRRFKTPGEWKRLLHEVSSDIKAFETANGIRLHEVVPSQFRNLGYGRLYDMATGPR